MTSFSSINLKFNPFGELDAEERREVACVDLGSLVNEVGQSKTAIQFLGDHGRGKTTHLLALHSHYRVIPYIKVFPDSRISLPKSNIYFIDSIENIPFTSRLSLYKKVNHLVFTTHKNLSIELKLMRLSVTTRRISQQSVNKLQTIFQRRVDYAKKNCGPAPDVTQDMVARLINKFGDNIRAMEHELYQHFNALRDSHAKM